MRALVDEQYAEAISYLVFSHLVPPIRCPITVSVGSQTAAAAHIPYADEGPRCLPRHAGLGGDEIGTAGRRWAWAVRLFQGR